MFIRFQTTAFLIGLLIVFGSQKICDADPMPLQVGQIHIQPITTVKVDEQVALAIEASGSGLEFEWKSLKGTFAPSSETPGVLYIPESPGIDVVTVKVTATDDQCVIRSIIFEIESNVTAVNTPTPITRPVPTPTPTSIPTSTPTPTPIPEPTPTPSPAVSATFTPPTPTPTFTPSPTVTPVVSSPTETPTPITTSCELRITQTSIADPQGHIIEPEKDIYSLRVGESVTIQVKFTNLCNYPIDVKWTAAHGEIPLISEKTLHGMVENHYTAKVPGIDHIKVFLLNEETGESLQKPIGITIMEN